MQRGLEGLKMRVAVHKFLSPTLRGKANVMDFYGE